MTREDPMEVCEVSESGTWSDSDCSSDVCDFWDGIIERRIDRIGRAPSPRRHSSIITSSIEALDEAKQVLEDAMEVIRYRHADEVQALRGVLEALQEHLECEEQAIAQSIATIHHQRNFLAPVMRLPPEILSRIFVFHAQIESSWLNAALTSTRVCKRWQEIGWACPELWSHINYRDCRSAAWMAGMIKRSCTLPLSLTIGNRAKVGAQKMALVIDNMHRFKSLDLHVPPEGGYWAFFEAFSQPVPLLEHLTVSSYARTVFAFPPEFLSGSAPNLRHMKLSTNSYIRWDSGLFSHLVTLEVSGSENFGGVTPPSLGMLLSALSRMPELETLILRHCFSPTPSTTVGAHVDLSNLKRLEVATSLTCCTCLLRQITISAGAIVLLDLEHCSSASREDVEKFFAVFPSHLYTTSPPVAQALKFTWRDSYDFNIDIWTVHQNTEFKTSQNASVKLVFNWGSVRSRGVSPLDLMWTCFAALASPQLSSFRTSGSHLVGWDAEVWRQLARVAPSLQRLAAGTKDQSTELCKALSPPDVPDPAPADCCFPALSYLEFTPPRDHPTPNPDGEESLFPVTLARSLAARALIGCSTPELAFVMSRRDYSKDWFYPFGDAVPGITVHTREWWREAVM